MKTLNSMIVEGLNFRIFKRGLSFNICNYFNRCYNQFAGGFK